MNNNRHKIIIVLLMTLVLMFCGDLLFNNLNTSKFTTWWTYSETYQNENIIIPIRTQGNAAKYKAGKSKHFTENIPETFPNIFDSKDNESSFSGIRNIGRVTVQQGTISAGKKESGNYTSSSVLITGTLAQSPNVKSKSVSDKIGGFATIGSSQPMAAPFAPNTGNTVLMVDPSTDPLESNRIPVGEGAWFLGLLALLYGGMTAIRRK